MIHYHGTPISPRTVLDALSGRNFCVSYARRDNIIQCHGIGQSVMLDNGAYSLWRRNPGAATYVWDNYYDWARKWLDYHTTWAVIPDTITGTTMENDRLIGKWFQTMGSFDQAAPVWHMHESLDRLDRLVSGFDRVCLGSSAEYAKIGDALWTARMDEAMNIACRGTGKPRTWLHMLRGLGLMKDGNCPYPFASADSTNVGQSHHDKFGGMNREDYALHLATAIDRVQCPARWVPR